VTDVRLTEFAQLLATADEDARDALISRVKLMAMQAAAPEAFEPPITPLGEYLERDIPVPPILVEPCLLVRGGIMCTVGRAGKGKDAPNDTPVLTPGGWKALGDVEVGDRVIDPATGRAARVSGVYPQGLRQVYRVTLSDGTSTESSDTHLWAVNKWNRDYYVKELREFKDDLTNSRGDNKWFLPLTRPVEYYNASPDIDGYVLGVLLGDGGLSNGNLNLVSSEQELVDLVAERLTDGCSLRKCGQHPLRWRIVGPSQGHTNPAISTLRKMGLWGILCHEKFIPADALFAPIEYRRDLLRGLIDTDGHVRTSNGRTTFYTASERLANDVASLVRSLGGVSKVSFRSRKSPFADAMTSEYSVSILVDFNPALLSRKAANWRRPSRYSRSIEAVEPSRVTETTCIMVDSQSHLYMQNDYIVTHNTQVNLNRILKWAAGMPLFPDVKTPNGVPVLAPTQPLKTLIIENEGAAGMFHKQIKTMMYADGYLTPPQRELVKENVLIWGDGGYSGLKLDDPNALNNVRAGCEKWEPDIVFIEPFRGLWSGDENSSTDMAKVADALSGIAADFNCGVILTHHEKKGGAGNDDDKMSAARGSTVLEGVVATMENFEIAKGGDYREISYSKIRYSGGEKILPIRMEWQHRDWWYRHVPLDAIEQAVLDVLAENEDPMTIGELVAETDEKEHKIRNIMKALVDQGKVKAMPSVHTGTGSTGKRYRLAVPTGDDTGAGAGMEF
jgi:hypothetical protein